MAEQDEQPQAPEPQKRAKRDTIPRKVQRRLRRIEDVDGRSVEARLARELKAGIIRDLGGDPSTLQSELATRAAMLSSFCSHAEAKWLTGESLDPNYLAAANALKRISETIGLKRVPRDIQTAPTLQEYLARTYDDEEETDSEETAKEPDDN